VFPSRLSLTPPSFPPDALIAFFLSDISRNSELSLQCYLRADEPTRGADGLADDLGNDVFLGGIKFVPDFDNMGNQDQWYEFAGGSGKLQIGVTYQPSYGQSLSIEDFELITVIGRGSFGRVCGASMRIFLSRFC
jgi:serum/glucocorticoid-regulated kinase 2